MVSPWSRLTSSVGRLLRIHGVHLSFILAGLAYEAFWESFRENVVDRANSIRVEVAARTVHVVLENNLKPKNDLQFRNFG